MSANYQTRTALTGAEVLVQFSLSSKGYDTNIDER